MRNRGGSEQQDTGQLVLSSSVAAIETETMTIGQLNDSINANSWVQGWVRRARLSEVFICLLEAQRRWIPARPTYLVRLKS